MTVAGPIDPEVAGRLATVLPCDDGLPSHVGGDARRERSNADRRIGGRPRRGAGRGGDFREPGAVVRSRSLRLFGVVRFGVRPEQADVDARPQVAPPSP